MNAIKSFTRRILATWRQDFELSLEEYRSELKGDIYFFGSVGIAVGLLENASRRLLEQGFGVHTPAVELLSDFMSIKALWLLAMSALAVTATGNLMIRFARPAWAGRATAVSGHAAGR